MTELKFYRKEEGPRPKHFDSDNLFALPYNFSTQTTVVYDDFAFVLTTNEIMLIKTKCEKVFYNNGKIGILDGNMLKIYENNTLIESLELQKTSNIFDFPMDGRADLSSIKSNEAMFVVNDKKMIISPEKITINGNSYDNEIHVKDCMYFVAYYGNLAILGNDKSLNFMYFTDGIIKEVDECHPLFVRIDEESYDSICPVDVKFNGSSVNVIYTDVITTFSVEGIEAIKNTKKINEYEIQGTEILQLDPISEEEFAIDNVLEAKNGPKVEDRESTGVEDSHITGKGTEEELPPVTDVVEPESGIRLGDDHPGAEASIEIPNIFSKSPIINSTVLTNGIGADKPKQNIFDLSKIKNSNIKDSSFISSIASASLQDLTKIKTEGPSSFEKPATNSFNFSTILKNSSFGFKNMSADIISKPTNSTTKEVIEDSMPKTQPKVESDLTKFDKDIIKRLNNLSMAFKKIEQIPTSVAHLEFSPSSFDLDGLYNLVFNNCYDDYEAILSSMIIKAEQHREIHYSNIKESVKFFDSKIFEKGCFKRAIKYNSPLCAKFNDIVRISNPIDDILEGIRVLKVTEKCENKNICFEKNVNKKDNCVAEPPVIPAIIPAPSCPIVQKQNTCITPEIAKPFQDAIVKPFVTENSLNTSQTPQLFSNNMSISNSFVVKDTSSLFSNLASSSLNTTNKNSASFTQAQQDTVSPTNLPETTGGSAFNRLAGSRKLFQ